MDAVGDALNYPYIRVRDVDWLKSTLLLFPHVARIRPAMGAPPDDPEIEPFTQIEGSRRLPLLRSFEADDATWDNQELLLSALQETLESGGDRLMLRFGEEATKRDAPSIALASYELWRDRLASRRFQVHSDKIFRPLRKLLENSGLAWQPSHPDGPNYLEMHPTVGEGVMAALAFAVARSRGCQLITEFPKIYDKTIQSTVDDVFSAITSTAPRRTAIPLFKKKGRRVAEVILYQRCDVRLLDAESLGVLSREREVLADFRTAVEKFAATIPDEMTNESEINSYVQDSADAVIAKWRESRKSLGVLARIFGDESEDTLKDIAKDGFKDATGGGLFAAPTGHALLGVGAGLAIGLAFRAFSGSKENKKSIKEPLRYLTLLRDHGVAVAVNNGRATQQA